MRPFHLAAAAALVSAGAVAALAIASGGPPRASAPEPQLRTVVGRGGASVPVRDPRRRTNATIRRAVAAAESAAVPLALADARRDAARLARSAGLELGPPIGVARDVAPYGWGVDPAQGRFGLYRWCGTVTAPRTHRRRRICQVPRDATVNVTLTVAAG